LALILQTVVLARGRRCQELVALEEGQIKSVDGSSGLL
jgi:hypothetical protein